MIKKIYILGFFILLFIFPKEIFLQESVPQEHCDCPYPIIFVHGWAGDETSWLDFSNEIKDIWGNQIIIPSDNNGEGTVYFANLNYNYNSTNIFGQNNTTDYPNYIDDDVIVHEQFFNAPTILPNECVYAISFATQRTNFNRVLLFSNSEHWNDDSFVYMEENQSTSNQSAPYKQGYALGKMIKMVLDITQKEKVILVGHSMGGLAIREYLQRDNGKWWVNQYQDHHVAKVLTVGTPHRGSNTGDWFSVDFDFDTKSEAVRDLRYTHDFLNYSIPGVYLFGGNESDIQVYDPGFYNNDVNCDGDDNQGDIITGINLNLDGTYDNPLMELPKEKIKYTFYVSNMPEPYPWGLSNSDGIVYANRQFLYKEHNGIKIPQPYKNSNYFLSDKIEVGNSYHVAILDKFSATTYETGDYNNVIRGIDEPDFPYFAYKIQPNKWYSGIPQIRADIVADHSNIEMIGGGTGTHDRFVDGDWYKFDIISDVTNVKIKVKPSENIDAKLDFFPLTGIDIYSNPKNGNLISTFPNSNGLLEVNSNSTFNYLPAGTYYFRITHNLHSSSNPIKAWKNPYKFKIEVDYTTNICPLTKITPTGNFSCNEYEVTIDGDPNKQYEIGEILNNYENAESVLMYGGTTANIPFNNDHSNLVSIYALDLSLMCDTIKLIGQHLNNCNLEAGSTSDFPSKINSPVIGAVFTSTEGTCNNNVSEENWCFWQWGAATDECEYPGTHCIGGGLVGGNGVQADDTYAWDCNKSNDRDAFENVYAVEDGERVTEGSWGGSSYNQLLIKHKMPNGKEWYSSYLHLDTRIIKDCYKSGELIGTVGSKGATNNHLHFAIYQKDANGTFVSKNTEIISNSCSINFGEVTIAGRAEAPVPIVVHVEVPDNFDINTSGNLIATNIKVGGVLLSNQNAINVADHIYKVVIDDLPPNSYQNETFYDIEFSLEGAGVELNCFSPAIVVFVGNFSTAFPNDVSYDDQAAISYIDRGTRYGLFKGGGGYFNSGGNLTRGQAAKVIAEMAFKLDINGFDLNIGFDDNFPDVSRCYEFYHYIQTMANNNYIDGYDDGEFKPNRDITFGEFSKMLVNVLGLDNGTYTRTTNIKHDGYQFEFISAAPDLIDKMRTLHEVVVLFDEDSEIPDGIGISIEPLIEYSYFNDATSGNTIFEVNGDAPITRKDMAIVLTKAYERLLYSINGSSSIHALNLRSALSEDFSNYTIIGSKLALIPNSEGNGAGDPVIGNNDIIILDNEVKEWDGQDSDPEGNPLDYYWTIDGGTLERVNPPNDFSHVKFTPPKISVPTQFELYNWIGNTKGKASQSFITITVYPTIGECSDSDPDTEDPIFLNCPFSQLVFGDDPDECGAYVNWSDPVADDNCMLASVSQTSGPISGSQLLPDIYNVQYTAIDTAGNTTTCNFQVKVVDTQLPEINCPQDVWVDNDLGVCGAVVNNIAPEFASDNCNYLVFWSALGASPSTGNDDASGTEFPVGTTTLTYTISELSNPDGNRTASCEVLVTVNDTENPIITCPDNVVIGTSMGGIGDCQGEYTWNHPTPTDNCGITVYTITFAYPNGIVEGPVNILGSEGASISHIFKKGITSMLYHVEDAAGNITECTWTVTVEDDENPEIFCEEVVVTNTYELSNPVIIKPSDTSTAKINVIPSANITDFNILSLTGTHPSMGDMKMTLTSPQGTEITLFDGLCASTADFDIGFDDDAAASVTTAPCNPFGNGDTYISQDLLSAFNGEDCKGIWTITMTSQYRESCGTLTDWEIEIIGNDIGTEYNRLQVVADPITCSYIMDKTDFDPPFSDNCPDPYILHDYIFGPFDNTLQGSEFQLGENLVTWVVYDQAGNTDTCKLMIDVLDTEKPHFLNCPTSDYIQDAEPGTCGAYVTFSNPIAEDNCTFVNVTQTDSTGLSSGYQFPVGMTILEYEAQDSSHNITICSLRVIVNDTQEPSFACVDNVLENTDPGKCGAKVFNIGPTLVSDNCIDNNSIVWQVEWPKGSGEIVNGGVVNASGEIFYKDTSRVTYRLTDQPLLLITEVTHQIDITNGGMHPSPYTVITNDDYLEITNIGSVTMNLSGLQIERLGNTDSEIYTIPDNTMMGVGKTLVIHYGNGIDDSANLFFNMPCAVDMSTGNPAAYIMSFKGRVLDVVAVNGFDPVGQGTIAIVAANDWSGEVASIMGKGGAYRRFSFDNNNEIDWAIAQTCNPLTIGEVNPDIDIATDNGAKSAFQLIPPHTITCGFDVVVVDQELPYCSEFHQHDYNNATNLAITNSIAGGVIYESIINVPDDFKIGELALINVQGQHPDMSELHFKLVGPSGLEVALFDGLCAAQADFDFNIANDTMPRIETAPCSPLGQAGIYSTENDISTVTFGFYGMQSLGDWKLIICDSVGANSGQLDNWELRLFEVAPYSQTDTTFANDFGFCGAEFTWIHPRLIDNCKEGIIELKFVTEDDINVPDTPGEVEPATEITRFFEVGTTTVRYILTDGSGNVDSCDFDVTILDTENPVVICPGDINIHLDGGQCRKVVCYEPELATDNCEVVDTTYSIEPCTFFEIGDTVVEIVIYDPAGNTASCIFDIKVYENEVDIADLACNDLVYISLDETCEAEILPDMLFEGNNYRCYEDYQVVLMYQNGDTLDTSPFVTAENLNDTLMYIVYDGDYNNQCMGTIIILKKIDPEIECPSDTTILCNIDPLRLENGELATGVLSLLSCELNVDISFDDIYTENDDCENPIAEVLRTFTLIDEDEQTVSCVQHIYISPFNLEQIAFPTDIVYECSDVSKNPQLLFPENTGYPFYQNGELITEWEELCNLSFNYEDKKLDICEGSYEILRTWIVRDRCIPVSSTNPVEYIQLIEVLDKQGAEIIHCPEDITVSTDQLGCEANVFLPIPAMINDYCSSISFEAEIFGNGFLTVLGSIENNNLSVFASKLDKDGNAHVRYKFEDGCGNRTYCFFNIDVVDDLAPIAACKQYKQVSLSIDGNAKLFADEFDSGSFDNCNPVYFKTLRVNDDLEYDRGCPDLNGDDDPHTGSIDVWYDDDVYYCCDDKNKDIMTSVRVFEVDPGTGPVDPKRMTPGGDLYGHYNDCWSIVHVECKIPPILDCPDIVITCEESLDPEENPRLWPKVLNVCEVELDYSDNRDMGVCGANIIRTWVAENCDLTTSCKQKISIENTIPFDPCTVKFPRNVKTDCPNNISSDSEPTWDENPCNVVTAEVINEDTFKFVDSACYKIIRDWAVIDWCVYDPNTGAKDNIDAISGTKLNCTQLVEDGYYKYTQVLMVTDFTPPTINVEDKCIATSDCYAHNVEMTASATDSCNVEQKFWWKYIVTNMDTWETVQYSYNYTPRPETGRKGSRSKDDLENTTLGKLVLLDPLPKGNYRVTWTVGDGCGNANSMKQYFTVVDKKAPTPVMVDIASAVMINGIVELKARTFDKGGCDFGCLSSFDNCTDKTDLYFTFTDQIPKLWDNTLKWVKQFAKYGKYFFDPETGAISTEVKYLAGEADAWLSAEHTSQRIFPCDYVEDGNRTQTIQVYVWDEFSYNEDCNDANYDFSNILLTLNHCGESSLVEGNVFNIDNKPVENMEITASNVENTYSILTDTNGHYAFESLDDSYLLNGFNNNNYLNGVTTLDIVIIQKYILGIKDINDPYKLIAADANANRKITASDLLEIRRVLLGAKERFTNNSWVAISNDYKFNNPALAFEEVNKAKIHKIDYTEDISNLDFIAIKIGDVNYSANRLESRNSNSIPILIDEINLKENREYTLSIYAKEFKNVFGFQFSINTPDLIVKELISDKLIVDNSNYNIIDNKLLFSWNNAQGISLKNNAVLFKIKIKSRVTSNLSDIISINEDILKSEIYTNNLDISKLKLEFRNTHSIFKLYQNEPNPFSEKTIIKFDLPQRLTYRLTLFDITGKIIKVINGEGKKGQNTVIINKNELNISGVITYKLQSGKNIDIKKMVVIK